MRDFKLFLLDQLLQEVVTTYVDVIRVRIGYEVNPNLNITVVVVNDLGERVSQIGEQKTPHVPQEERRLKSPCQHNALRLTRGYCGVLLDPRNPLDIRTPTYISRLHPRQKSA